MDSEIQRIARLTSLADVLASFDMGIAPVTPRSSALGAALGRTLAADVVVEHERPKVALALRDGYALSADATADANSYAPALLAAAPAAIVTGEPMPMATDAVAFGDAVTLRGAGADILSPVAPGDGVLPAGGDAAANTRLALAGARLRRIDVAVMSALGVEQVAIRVPRVRIVRAATGAVIDAAAALIADAVDADGGAANADGQTLDQALQKDDADAVIAVGGTGSGRNDCSVRILARHGRAQVHGIGIMPGETTAFGHVGTRPVLLLPGRLDSALAGWLTIGRRMLARLAFRLIEEQPFTAELSRKVASPLGLAEVVPVRRRGYKVEPLASGYLSLHTLSRADGWILIPADSEGHPPGASVVVRPWP